MSKTDQMCSYILFFTYEIFKNTLDMETMLLIKKHIDTTIMHIIPHEIIRSIGTLCSNREVYYSYDFVNSVPLIRINYIVIRNEDVVVDMLDKIEILRLKYRNNNNNA